MGAILTIVRRIGIEITLRPCHLAFEKLCPKFPSVCVIAKRYHVSDSLSLLVSRKIVQSAEQIF